MVITLELFKTGGQLLAFFPRILPINSLLAFFFSNERKKKSAEIENGR